MALKECETCIIQEIMMISHCARYRPCTTVIDNSFHACSIGGSQNCLVGNREKKFSFRPNGMDCRAGLAFCNTLYTWSDSRNRPWFDANECRLSLFNGVSSFEWLSNSSPHAPRPGLCSTANIRGMSVVLHLSFWGVSGRDLSFQGVPGGVWILPSCASLHMGSTRAERPECSSSLPSKRDEPAVDETKSSDGRSSSTTAH